MSRRTALSTGVLPIAVLLAGVSQIHCGPTAPRPDGVTAPSSAAAPASADTASVVATSAATTTATARAAPVRPPVPDGVIARVQGRAGEILVEQRDGQRRLTVAGVQQGATKVDPRGHLLDPYDDPTADLLTHFDIETALVVGLGTGRTTAALHAHRRKVTAVEIDPVVIDIARKHFGLPEGIQVLQADGAEHLRRDRTRYDLVLVDAFSGAATPKAFESAAVLRALRDCAGILAFRLIASPADRAVKQLQERLAYRYAALFAAGVGDEVQPLLLLGSQGHLDTVALAALDHAYRRVAAGVSSKPADPQRGHYVQRTGYLSLVRDQPCLDLPHDDMGVVRYRLLGPGAASLQSKLNGVVAAHTARRTAVMAKARHKPIGMLWEYQRESPFPTAGDIGTDGDLSGTLKVLVGGGGVKRNAVRFSPLVVQVRGWAKANHDEALTASGFRPPPPGGRQIDTSKSLLTHGGWLYDLQVDAVDLVIERRQWDARRPRLKALANQAAMALSAGQLTAAQASMERYRAALEQAFHPAASDLLAYREIQALLRDIDDERAVAPRRSSPLERAAACDRLASAAWGANLPHVHTVQRGARHCAERGYERIIASPASTAPDRTTAAGRLAYWIDLYDDEHTDAERKRRWKRLKELQQAYPGSAERHREPPPRPREPQDTSVGSVRQP